MGDTGWVVPHTGGWRYCGGVMSFFFSSRRRHTRSDRDWSSDVCSSDLLGKTLRQRLDEERLAEARHALEQHVAAREHADEDVVDDLAVTDDDLLDLRAQRLERGDEFPNPAVVGHRVSSLWMTSPGATTPGPILIIICKRHATPRLLTRARKRAPARSQDGRAPRRHGARCPSRERAYSQLPVAAASGRRVGRGRPLA